MCSSAVKNRGFTRTCVHPDCWHRAGVGSCVCSYLRSSVGVIPESWMIWWNLPSPSILACIQSTSKRVKYMVPSLPFFIMDLAAYILLQTLETYLGTIYSHTSKAHFPYFEVVGRCQFPIFTEVVATQVF